MQLPNAENAVIEPAKLRDYLLSPSHPWGRFKLAFFATLGYTQDDWEQLAADLRAQHLPRDAVPGRSSPYGAKYEIRAPLQGPSGRIGDVLSIWIVRRDETIPRFVTAIPS